jgi:hypothetical protein
LSEKINKNCPPKIRPEFSISVTCLSTAAYSLEESKPFKENQNPANLVTQSH